MRGGRRRRVGAGGVEHAGGERLHDRGMKVLCAYVQPVRCRACRIQGAYTGCRACQQNRAKEKKTMARVDKKKETVVSSKIGASRAHSHGHQTSAPEKPHALDHMRPRGVTASADAVALALRRLSSSAAGCSGRGSASRAACSFATAAGRPIGGGGVFVAAPAPRAARSTPTWSPVAVCCGRAGYSLSARGFAASALARAAAESAPAAAAAAASAAATTASAAAGAAAARSPRDALSRGPRALVRAYKQLAKFRLTCLVVATAAAGFVAGE